MKESKETGNNLINEHLVVPIKNLNPCLDVARFILYIYIYLVVGVLFLFLFFANPRQKAPTESFWSQKRKSPLFRACGNLWHCSLKIVDYFLSLPRGWPTWERRNAFPTYVPWDSHQELSVQLWTKCWGGDSVWGEGVVEYSDCGWTVACALILSALLCPPLAPGCLGTASSPK